MKTVGKIMSVCFVAITVAIVREFIGAGPSPGFGFRMFSEAMRNLSHAKRARFWSSSDVSMSQNDPIITTSRHGDPPAVLLANHSPLSRFVWMMIPHANHEPTAINHLPLGVINGGWKIHELNGVFMGKSSG